MDKRKPSSNAFRIELGNVQRAMIQQISIALHSLGIKWITRYKFVDMFKALIVAHVDNNAIIFRKRYCRAFVLDTAERCPFYRHRLWIQRINLDHPAKAIWLVRMQ